MTETMRTPPYKLAQDDKAASVMVYTSTALYWGEVVVKEMIRVSTWLRTNSAPDRLCLYNAKAMPTNTTAPVKPVQFTELHIAASQVLAYHLMPPAKDPPDFDATEPNRKMEPVSLLVGSFRIDGLLRISTQSSIAKYLEVARESFTPVYEAQISNMNMQGMKPISIPFLLVRQETAVFTSRS